MAQLENLKGRTFTRWKVLYRAPDYIAPKSGQHRVRWHCRCECGTERDIDATCLKNEASKSCGCLSRDLASKAHFMDLTDKHFDKLKVIKRVEDRVYKNGRHTMQWLCECECGNTRIATTNDLRSGDAHSCGCDSIYTIQKNKYLKSQSVANCGLIMTLIQYHNTDNVDIQFEDGVIIKHTRLKHFLSGGIRHPKIKSRGITKEYHGYQNLQPVYRINTNVFYTATCTATDTTKITTLQQILKEETICKQS